MQLETLPSRQAIKHESPQDHPVPWPGESLPKILTSGWLVSLGKPRIAIEEPNQTFD